MEAFRNKIDFCVKTFENQVSCVFDYIRITKIASKKLAKPILSTYKNHDEFKLFFKNLYYIVLYLISML